MIRDKIIIVEDDPGISKYLQAALRSHEYDTLLAPDGKTALEMISGNPGCLRSIRCGRRFPASDSDGMLFVWYSE